MELEHSGYHSPYRAIGKGFGMRVPVATKATAGLPSHLTLVWMSIEQVCEWLEILAQLAIEGVSD